MSSIRCLFRPHKWVFISNVMGMLKDEKFPVYFGLYQCSRCKEISVGLMDGLILQTLRGGTGDRRCQKVSLWPLLRWRSWLSELQSALASDESSSSCRE